MNKKELKKLYSAHCENIAPDMEKLWEKIESGLEEKPENGVTSKQVRTVNFRAAAAWCAVCAAIVISVPSVILGGARSTNGMDSAERSGAASYEKAAYENAASNPAETAGDGLSYTAPPAAEAALSSLSSAEEGVSEEETEAIPPNRVYYEELDLAPVLYSNRPSEMPYAEPAGDEFFVEEKVLAETDIIVDAVVDMVYSSGNGTVCYVLSAEDSDKNDMSGITVESASPYLLQMNREYILPLKANEDMYSLVFENAPQIECTRDGGVIFHNGWKSLDEHSDEVIYPQTGADDFFYDRMRFSYTDGMTVLSEKKQILKNEGD